MVARHPLLRQKIMSEDLRDIPQCSVGLKLVDVLSNTEVSHVDAAFSIMHSIKILKMFSFDATRASFTERCSPLIESLNFRLKSFQRQPREQLEDEVKKMHGHLFWTSLKNNIGIYKQALKEDSTGFKLFTVFRIHARRMTDNLKEEERNAIYEDEYDPDDRYEVYEAFDDYDYEGDVDEGDVDEDNEIVTNFVSHTPKKIISEDLGIPPQIPQRNVESHFEANLRNTAVSNADAAFSIMHSINRLKMFTFDATRASFNERCSYLVESLNVRLKLFQEQSEEELMEQVSKMHGQLFWTSLIKSIKIYKEALEQDSTGYKLFTVFRIHEEEEEEEEEERKAIYKDEYYPDDGCVADDYEGEDDKAVTNFVSSTPKLPKTEAKAGNEESFGSSYEDTGMEMKCKVTTRSFDEFVAASGLDVDFIPKEIENLNTSGYVSSNRSSSDDNNSTF